MARAAQFVCDSVLAAWGHESDGMHACAWALVPISTVLAVITGLQSVRWQY